MAAKKKMKKKVVRAATDDQIHQARASKADMAFEKIVAEWNKDKSGERGPIPLVRASETSSSYLLRRPTGVTSIDLAIAGGFAAGTVNVLVGPDGVGKDYLFWSTAAEVQKIYGANFRMAVYLTELKMDKQFIRDWCGFKVACTPSEMDEIDDARERAGLAPLTPEEREEYSTSIGEVFIMQGVTAEEALDRMTMLVRSNGCQLVGVNSLGFFETEAKEKVDSLKENPQQRSEAQVLTRFMTRLCNIMNQAVMNEETGKLEANETTVLLVNQVRAAELKRVAPGKQAQDKDKYKSGSEVWAVKHGKAIEISLHKGKRLYDETAKKYYGKEIQWEITKGKLGLHEGARGSMSFLYAGCTGVDKIDDLVGMAKDLGVLEASGSWLTAVTEDGEVLAKEQSRAKFCAVVENDTNLYRYLRKHCFAAAKITYRHK
jgi:RecA/RadA recombinase